MTDIEEDEEVETVYTFDELSERAKDKARDKYRESDHLDYEWWDNVYEDAVRMGKLIGIDIDIRRSMTTKGRQVQETAINFSGFWCQGDGACFEGSYSFLPDAYKNIETECNDEKLLRIANELTVLQLTRRLMGYLPFSASITTSGRYSHSGTMDVNLHADDDDGMSDGNTFGDAFERDVQQLMRDFADWIYKNLEAEHDYLTSDECIDQYLTEEKFNEDGEIV